jgi:hypothetical protein
MSFNFANEDEIAHPRAQAGEYSCGKPQEESSATSPCYLPGEVSPISDAVALVAAVSL